MASGSFSVSTSNANIAGYLNWSSSSNVSNNTSTVTATMYLSRINTGYTTYGSGSFTVVINGVSYTNSGSFTFSYNSNTACVSYTVTVPHNADGTKAISISCSGGLPSTSLTSSSGGGTAYLDTIPRATQPTLNLSTIDYGSAVTITLSRASSSFTHTLRYSWSTSNGTIATGVATSYTWTVPTNFMNNIPNATSSWGTIYCDTYNGSTLIGTKSVTLTTTVPVSVVPTFTTIIHSDMVNDVGGNIGAYVQSLSKLKLDITGATGAYSSTISSYSITFDGVTYTSNTATTGGIKGSGTMTITGTVVDSRGRSASKAVSITVLSYSPPTVTAFNISRANSDGTANAVGTSINIRMIGAISNLNNKNTLRNVIYYKVRGDSTWTSIYDETKPAGTLNIDHTEIFSSYDIALSYDFRLDIIDLFNTTISLLVLPTATVTMSWGKAGIGVGKVLENGALDVRGDTYVEGNIYENGTKLTDKYMQKADESKYIKGQNASGTDNSFTDFNAVWKSGFYDINGGSNNPAGSGWVWLLNMAHNGDNSTYKYGSQFAVENISSNPRAWYRNRNVDGAGTWQQLISTTPRFTWTGTATYNTAVTITHNLGYYPLVSVETVTQGNTNTTWKHVNTNQIQLFNWNTGANNASVVIRFY